MLDTTSHVYPTERATTQFSERNDLKHRLDHPEIFIRLIIGTDRSKWTTIISESVNAA